MGVLFGGTLPARFLLSGRYSGPPTLPSAPARL